MEYVEACRDKRESHGDELASTAHTKLPREAPLRVAPIGPVAPTRRPPGITGCTESGSLVLEGKLGNGEDQD